MQASVQGVKRHKSYRGPTTRGQRNRLELSKRDAQRRQSILAAAKNLNYSILGEGRQGGLLNSFLPDPERGSTEAVNACRVTTRLRFNSSISHTR